MRINKRKYCFYRLVFNFALGLILVFSYKVAQVKANNDKPLEKVILQLTWYHEFQFAGYYAAQLKGYYQEEGLEVEIRERSPGQLPVDVVLSGDADFGNATSDIMLLRMQGKPVVALAVIMQHSPWVLLVRADSGITVPEDLIGKTVSMDMSYRDVEIQAMFKNENISNENITIVKKEPGVENLINGIVDARVSYMTSQPFDLQKRGFEPRILRPINYGIDFYGDTLFTTERQIREHPQRVAAFRRASLRGWQYAMDHPDELTDYIYSTYYADPTQATMPYSLEHFRFEAKVMAEDLIHPKLIEIGHMNPHRWRRIADTYTALGMVGTIDTLNGFIYDPDPEPDYKWVRWTVGIVVVILLVVGIYTTVLIVFNRRLRHVVRLRTSALSQTNQTLVQEAYERKRAESELENYRKHLEALVNERTSELEEVHAELVSKERLAALGELIATVSHEIRNPLGTIRNAVYSIGEAIDNNKIDVVNRALKLAERNITRCNRIINELLDYTRKREIKLERTEIDSWLNGVLDEQEFPKEIECVRELHSGITLLIDHEYMRRVVSNVIMNAIQALQEVDSRRNRITVESVKTGEWLELRFTDTGPGIPDEIREKIFEPLFSTKSFGVGLGVPIVKNIMEEHQGEVKFQSGVDKGTVVTLTLPIHKLEKKR